MRVISSTCNTRRLAAVLSALMMCQTANAASPVETVVEVLCKSGVRYFLASECHGYDSNLVTNSAIMDGILNTGQSMTFARESYNELRDMILREDPKSEAGGKLTWLMAQHAASNATRKVNVNNYLQYSSAATWFVSTVNHPRVHPKPMFFEHLSSDPLGEAISTPGNVIISAGLMHLEGIWQSRYQMLLPWQSTTRTNYLEFAFPMGERGKSRYGAFARLAKARTVAIVRPDSVAQEMSKINLDDAAAPAFVSYYNGLGYAVLELTSASTGNTTVIFPAEHLANVKSALKPRKRVVYTCNNECADVAARSAPHDEL
jgi:hypothetical protein